MERDDTTRRRRGRPPGTKRFHVNVNTPVPRDFRTLIEARAHEEGTTVAALARRALYREFGYQERTA